MSDHAELPPATRDPVERLTDETLRRPLRSLSKAEKAMVRSAIKNRPSELQNRIEQIRVRKVREGSILR